MANPSSQQPPASQDHHGKYSNYIIQPYIQIKCLYFKYLYSGVCDDKESISSGAGIYGGPPIFQNLLMRFLDNDAPILGLYNQISS